MKRLLFLLAVLFCETSIFAQWDGTSAPWTQGTGSENNPYLIESPQHLAYLSDMVLGQIDSYAGKYFLLTNDIDLNNQPWAPIGTQTNRFQGNFDGGNHQITGLNITAANTYRGLFGYAEGATIMRLSIDGSINGNSTGGYAGGVVGVGENLVVANCTNYCAITNAYYAGGIIGKSNSSMVLNCSNYGSVKNTISNNNMFLGGIVGYSNGTTIRACSNHDTICAINNTTLNRSAHIGGIVGYCLNINPIEFCNNDAPIYNTGRFSSTYLGSAGGIVGYAYSSTDIYSCFNLGAITLKSSAAAGYSVAGGIFALKESGVSLSIKNCYSSGNFSISNSAAYGVTQYTSSNSYYRSGCGATTGGIERTESQMKSVSFPTMLNTDSTVFVYDQNNENEGYPVFWFDAIPKAHTDSSCIVSSYNANVSGHYSGHADSVGFLWGRASSNTLTKVTLGATPSSISYTLSNLQPNTNYRYAFFAKYNGQMYYGDTLTFRTKPLYNVSATSNNNAWGSVSGSGTYGFGESCILTAIPDSVSVLVGVRVSYYEFVQWSDRNTDNPRTITVESDTSLQAIFAPKHYTVTLTVNNSAWGRVTGAGVYEYWSPVVLFAIPNDGYHLKYWRNMSGNLLESSNPINIEHITGNWTREAIFEPDQYTITVLANDSTMGYVSGSGVYNYGEQVYISAAARSGYIFTQWSDGATEAYRLVTVTENMTFTAIFTDAIFNITGQSNNATFGSVTGSGSYARGSQVQLTAMPNDGYHFTQWNDGNTDNPRTITVNADATYTAQFAINTYVVNVNSNNNAMGSATGGGIFSYNQHITIEATALPHYRFVQWNDGETSNPRVATITSDSTFTAQFEQLPQYTITVVSADETKGSVNGGGTFYGGEHTVISATPASGNVFDRWSDGSTNPTLTITVNADVIYTAYFSGVRCTVNVYSNDDQLGFVSGGGEYESGQQATVTATPANECRFVRWSNGVEQNPYSFTVYSDVNLIANFERTNGIADGDKETLQILADATTIHIYGANNMPVSICDIMGRILFSCIRYDGQNATMPSDGIYFIRVGDTVKKIVLIH